jgi:hypothetical protein
MGAGVLGISSTFGSENGNSYGNLRKFCAEKINLPGTAAGELCGENTIIVLPIVVVKSKNP